MGVNLKIIQSRERRAVAPIIATLLMVAIAVVGGILIFVFAQGFFTDTNIAGPSIDSLEIFGFDARDSGLIGAPICSAATSRASHTGTCITSVGATASTANTNRLNEGDPILIYVRNSGGKAVTVSSVNVAGRTYALEDVTTDIATGQPGSGEFILANEPTITDFTETGRKTGGTATVSGGVINPGEEKTLVIRFKSATTADNVGPVTVKIGRSVQVTITTGNGAVFTANVQNGTARGV